MRNSILVNNVQRGNPVLKHIRNVPYEFGDILPDFLLGQTTCAFFLSLKYHGMHPQYLLGRVREIGRNYRLRVLLVVVDISDASDAIQELDRFSVLHSLCIILAWSIDEAARYLETYKAYENKGPEQLQERVAKDYMSVLTNALTTIKSVNKTDAVTIASTFGCLKDLARAPLDDIRLCPGFGERKAERLFSLLDEPFVRPVAARPNVVSRPQPALAPTPTPAPTPAPADRSTAGAAGATGGRAAAKGAEGVLCSRDTHAAKGTSAGSATSKATDAIGRAASGGADGSARKAAAS